MRKITAVAVVLMLQLGVSASADPAAPVATALNVKTDASTVTYHIVHKLHRVDGVSKRVEGKARMLPGGLTQVGVRIPVDSFDSGNSNRDAHMKEATEAARYPYVELKAVAEGLAIPTTFPSTVQKTWKAQLSFHGISQAMDLPVTLKFEAADRVIATASLQLSLDAYKVERPSLMFVKIDDAMKIDVNLTFVP